MVDATFERGDPPAQIVPLRLQVFVVVVRAERQLDLPQPEQEGTLEMVIRDRRLVLPGRGQVAFSVPGAPTHTLPVDVDEIGKQVTDLRRYQAPLFTPRRQRLMGLPPEVRLDDD